MSQIFLRTLKNKFIKLENTLFKTAIELFVFNREKRRRLKGKFCQKFLMKYVKKVESEMLCLSTNNEKTYRIWQYWNSGIENAPDLVKACMASVDKYRGNIERIVLDDNNIKDYVSIPDYIYKLKEKGIISNTHFSDILRTYLLYEHGGCWIDATVLLTDYLPDYITKSELFVFTNEQKNDPDNLGMTSYFISSLGNSKIIAKAKRLLELYWKENDFLLNYFLFLHAFTLLMQSSEENKKEYNEMYKFSYLDVQKMEKELLNKFSEERFEELKKISSIHKLSYKWKVIARKKEIKLADTIYEYIIENFGFPNEYKGVGLISKPSFLQNLKSKLTFLFSIQDIDEHYVIKIFGIKICKKHKYDDNFSLPSEYGITKVKRKRKLIVSLTTFPARINIVHKTISTLLQQTLKPDEVILWLAKSQFPNKELPKTLTDLEQYGLTIKWCEDIRSYKKLIPSLIEYPNDIIVTTDDDTYYDKKLLEYLYNEYLLQPNCIHARQAFVLKQDKKGEFYMQARKYTYNSTYLPSFWNEPVGCGGVLYPPNSLHKNVLNVEQCRKELPTHDDLWFWGHALINGTKINVIKDNYKLKNLIIEGSQEDSLWQKNMINSTSTEGMTGKQALNKVCKLFPEIVDRLK